jgi:glycosyltransferase involved in cell wall biosynthesis
MCLDKVVKYPLFKVMNVLCVIDSLGSGGAQRQIVELAKGFKEMSCNVSFLVYHEENFFKGELDDANIPVVSILESNYFKRLFKMRKYIRKNNFDAVLSFLEAANFICEFAGLPWKNWKLIVGERSANPNIFKSFKLKFYRWFHLFADHVVANSHENLRMIQKVNPLLSLKKCRVIYNLVDLGYWKPVTDYTLMKDQKLKMVVVASHQHIKNAKGLIEAVDFLNESEKGRIKVSWYGDERSDDSLQIATMMIEQRGLQNIFTFHNATNEIRNKMQYADVVGLFSFYEGLPNVICEAMGIGKPIIAAAVSDMNLLLANNLNCTFDPRNSKDISRALSYILSLSSGELTKMGKINRIVAGELFNKRKILSSYLVLFK